MTIITINTYGVAGRFDIDKEEAKKFFKYVENIAIDAEYGIDYVEAISTDEYSEQFIEKAFRNYCPK